MRRPPFPNFARKADADRFAASVETDKAPGEWIDPRLGKTTVEDWAEGWLQRLAHVRPKTRVGYESLLRTCVLPTFGTTPLARVEQPAVAAWVAEMRAHMSGRHDGSELPGFVTFDDFWLIELDD